MADDMNREVEIMGKLNQAAQRGKPHIKEVKNLELSPEEKAEQLWGMFSEYSAFRGKLYKDRLTALRGDPKTRREDPKTPRKDHPNSVSNLTREERDVVLQQVGQNPLIQRLEGKIAELDAQPAVRTIVARKIKEAMKERVPHALAFQEYRGAIYRSKELEKKYFDLLRNQFLMRQMTPTLRRIDIATNRAEKDRVEATIVDLEETGGMPKKEKDERGGLDAGHADRAALLAHERIKDYQQQFKRTGIILTPSREHLLDDVLTKTSNGTWILLSGETGTGKSIFAKTTSLVLNGEPPVGASGGRWGDPRGLIGTKTMDGTGKVYYDFGPLTTALTGCHNSLEMEEAIKSGAELSGKVFNIEELNKFDQDTLFEALKIIPNLRPGEVFNYKELPGVRLKMVKKGFGIIASMNPSSVRYERKELDQALERLFQNGKEKLDYLPMTDQNPELYEAFLGVLMDDNGRIRVAREELAPSFTEDKDSAAGIVREVVNPDVTQHGSLYRFALAASEIHKSYSQKPNIAETAIDPGYLEKVVLDMQVLVEWMRDYSAEVEGGASLTTYLERRLNGFYKNIDNVSDKAIFKRVFDHFGFEIEAPTPKAKPNYAPLTPLEIGYLTPRTPHAVRKEGEAKPPEPKIYINELTGEETFYLPIPIETDRGRVLNSQEVVMFEGKKYQFLGKDPNSNQGVFVAVE